MKATTLVFAIFLLACSRLHALDLREFSFEGARMTVVEVDLRKDTLELFLNDNEGHALKSFARLEDIVRAEGKHLLFATNAGMYEPDYSAVGLFVSNGRESNPLNLRSGNGNFYLKPNGVFFVNEDGARIVDASAFPKFRGKVQLATQSGPLLVLNGRIHRAFKPDSTSRLIRNGVGVVDRHRVVIVMAETPVNFYTFAMFFRNELGCEDALFLDGKVSSLYWASEGRKDRKISLGPIIGVTTSN